MKKVFALSQIVFISLFLASFILAQTTITNPIGASNFKELITKIADGVAIIIGPVAVIMFIVAGILYLTSAGNPERINSAKACLMYAIIGIAVAISAKGMAEFIESTLK